MTLQQLMNSLAAIPAEYRDATVEFMASSDYGSFDEIQFFKPGNMLPFRAVVLLVEDGACPEDHYEPDILFRPGREM